MMKPSPNYFRVVINILFIIILILCFFVIIKMLRCVYRAGTSALCCCCKNTKSSETRKDLKIANILLKDYRKTQTEQGKSTQKLPILWRTHLLLFPFVKVCQEDNSSLSDKKIIRHNKIVSVTLTDLNMSSESTKYSLRISILVTVNIYFISW